MDICGSMPGEFKGVVQLEQERADMSDLVAIAVTAICIVAGGYGLYKAAFARGYANGYEEATHPDGITFKEE